MALSGFGSDQVLEWVFTFIDQLYARSAVVGFMDGERFTPFAQSVDTATNRDDSDPRTYAAAV